tara:strand:+ start:71 stop:412 length:342 start_codon:yes stop_codon:yes gene_type:complete
MFVLLQRGNNNTKTHKTLIMNTLQELHTAVTNKGFEFEIYTVAFNRFGDTIGLKNHQKTFFGFGNVDAWFWFEGYTDNDAENLFFSEKYFRNSGKSYKTWKKRREALDLLGLS